MPYDVFQNDEEDEKNQVLNPTAPMAMGPGLAQAAADSAPLSSAGGVTGDKFTNFDRYFAANKDTAQRTAGEVAGKVGSSAEAAARGIDKAGAAFQKDAYGNTVKGPGGSTPMSDADVKLWNEFNPGRTDKPTSYSEAKMYANMPYQGPTSLVETQGYGDLDLNAQKAQSGLNALGSLEGIQALRDQNYAPISEGGSRMDAALMGQAGKKQFGDVQKHYGKLSDYLSRAVTSSADTADWAKRESASNSKAWGDQVSAIDAAEEKKRLDAEKAAEEKRKNPKQFSHKLRFDEYNAWNPEDYVRFAGKVSSPIDLAMMLGGEKGPMDYRTDQYEDGTNGKFDSGRSHAFDNNSKEDMLVYYGMTDQELADLEKMGPRHQKQWIEMRKKEMRARGDL